MTTLAVGVYYLRSDEGARTCIVARSTPRYATIVTLAPAGLAVARVELSRDNLARFRPIEYPLARAVRRYRAFARAPGRELTQRARLALAAALDWRP